MREAGVRELRGHLLTHARWRRLQPRCQRIAKELEILLDL
jgi:hypothetical protein